MRAVELRKFQAKVSRQGGCDAKEATMVKNFEDVQKFGKDNVDATLRSFGALSKSVQAVAAEVADYSKRSFDDGSKVVEKLIGAKSLDKAIEIQADYAKTAYEGFVAQATKIGELYLDAAREAYKPFETAIAKATPAK
jgi:hypothetical protein